MDAKDLNQRLSQISTLWSALFRAHGEPGEARVEAQKDLLMRYHEAIYRYLLGAVRDPDAADELAQEFALRFLRGGFRNADPGRGRFRDYLKAALIHLVTDHHRVRRDAPLPLRTEVSEPIAPAVTAEDADRDFLASWRGELLSRTWGALAEAQPSYHAVLSLRIEEPDATSAEMAERLTARLGRPMRADRVRKALQRAHARFVDLLLDEVARSLGPDPDVSLEEELRDLDLLKYSRSALDRRSAVG